MSPAVYAACLKTASDTARMGFYAAAAGMVDCLYLLSDARTAHSGQAATPRAGNGGAVNDNASKDLAAGVRHLSR